MPVRPIINRRVLISGCSGGGKSTLLKALARRGFGTVAEPGLRIVHEEQAKSGAALPWIDLTAFARRTLDLALADYRSTVGESEWTFFDRGWIDAASALDAVTGTDHVDRLNAAHRYHDRVFLAPPWPEIFSAGPDRRHDIDSAISEYERLAAVYPAIGYSIILLPRLDVEARADWMLNWLRI